MRIIAYSRTYIGRYKRGFKNVKPTDMLSKNIQDVIYRTSEIFQSTPLVVSKLVDQAVIGNVFSSGLGQCMATQAIIDAGISPECVSYSINKVCASGMKAAIAGCEAILLGKADLVISGGVENMSAIPRISYPDDPSSSQSGLIVDGLSNSASKTNKSLLMGEVAELSAHKHGISREEMDQYAILSYSRSLRHRKEIDEECFPYVIEKDECLDLFDEKKLVGLSQAFPASKYGTITAGNACKLADGSACMVLGSDDVVERLGGCAKMHVVVKDTVDISVDPDDFSIAPSVAISKILERNSLTAGDVGVYEINEAFSSVPIINAKLVSVPIDIVNPAGGSVAIGHPLGSTGIRIIGTLSNRLKRNKIQYGIAAICNGGGGASAVLLENEALED